MAKAGARYNCQKEDDTNEVYEYASGMAISEVISVESKKKRTINSVQGDTSV